MTPVLRVSISVALLLTALSVLQFRSAGEAVPLRKSLDLFPSAFGQWQGRQDTALEPQIINQLKVNDYLVRRYVHDSGQSLWLYIGYWATQRKGADFHSPKNCLPGAGWEPVEATRIAIDLPGPDAAITVNRYVIQKDRTMQVVLYWYQTHGRAIAGEVDAKIELVRSAIIENRTDGALVRVSSIVAGSPQATTERLIQYVRSVYPVLHEFLPE
ncbi:MAG: exosortase C-terminal domain/associated protein EpsI [Candidatus Rokuibacteriota bacterium]